VDRFLGTFSVAAPAKALIRCDAVPNVREGVTEADFRTLTGADRNADCRCCSWLWRIWTGPWMCHHHHVVSDADPGRRLLIDSVMTLATDAAAQRPWVERHRVPTDEFALDFDHAFGLVPALADDGRLDPDVVAGPASD
jgi:hypothetical protein